MRNKQVSTGNPFRRRLCRRLICLVLILNILIWPGTNLALSALPSLASNAINLTINSIRQLSITIGSLLKTANAASRSETLEDRLASVARIRVSPFKFVGYEGQAVTFTAIGTNSEG